jgi:Lon protease-like protein
MFPASTHIKLRKTRSRRRKLKSRQTQLLKSKKIDHRTTQSTSLVSHFHDILNDLKRPGTRFSSYTITELEPICQQIAIQVMSSTTPITDCCPFICIFCQNFIYAPITLYCGHTFCDQCIKDDEFSSSVNCPRCPENIQGQITSSILHAREKSYKKNRFLTELFENSESLKIKCEMISLCHQGQKEYSNGNYQKAIEIYSNVIDQSNDDHLALYNRAKAYKALKQYDQALNDATHVVTLKSQWAKGYLCQSEILFEMNHFISALMSSLRALVIDPEDQAGKRIMAQHLHAVLQNNDEEAIANIDSELEQFNKAPLSHDDNVEATTSVTDTSPLTICKSKQPTASCFCLQFDYKNLNIKDFDCSICVNLLWFPVTTPCGHVFCRECLIRSVDNTQILCPICKSSLDDFFPMLIQSHVNKTEIISKIIETYFPTEYNERNQLHQEETSRSTLIPQNDNESNIFEIPIFVCVSTLPNCVCPLHVFEPRYRLMMRRTIETESRTFGMCSYDEQTQTFTDYGTLLFIRGLVYTQDGWSIVDTIGQRRFRVIERGMKDGYDTARVQLIRDDPIEQHEFDDLFQLNRVTYTRVREWFDHLDAYRRTLITRQLEEYPPCDDLTVGSTDGPSWAWIMLNLLPIEQLLQLTVLASRSFRIRLQTINDTMDFLLNQQPQQGAAPSNDE